MWVYQFTHTAADMKMRTMPILILTIFTDCITRYNLWLDFIFFKFSTPEVLVKRGNCETLKIISKLKCSTCSSSPNFFFGVYFCSFFPLCHFLCYSFLLLFFDNAGSQGLHGAGRRVWWICFCIDSFIDSWLISCSSFKIGNLKWVWPEAEMIVGVFTDAD